MNKKDFLIVGAGIILLAVITLLAVLIPPEVPKEMNAITEKTEYKMGDTIKVKIENNLKKNICFSSCYPYYLERKNGEWESYRYIECPDSDLIESCVNSGEVKAFEFTMPSVGTGLHRLVIPACIGCSPGENFREDQKFYSNEFVIK